MYSKCGNNEILLNYANRQQRPQTMHAATDSELEKFLISHCSATTYSH